MRRHAGGIVPQTICCMHLLGVVMAWILRWARGLVSGIDSGRWDSEKGGISS